MDHNKIKNIDSVSNLRKLHLLYLKNNSLTNISSIEQIKSLFFIDLSYNRIENIDYLSNSPIFYLTLNNNNIRDIRVLKNMTYLTKLDISSNSITKFEKFSNEMIYLKQIFIDNDLISIIDDVRNIYFEKKNINYVYYQAIFAITTSKQDNRLDCLFVLKLSKRNILFNLLFNNQIEQFFNKCFKIELDF